MEDLIRAAGLALAGSDLARWAGSAIVYPVANVLHLLGLVLLLGGIGIVDLRIAGAFRALPMAALTRALTPLGVTGLLILLASGATLLAADAPATLASATFRWKLAAIALALVNAMLFRRRFAGLGKGQVAAPPARIMALASLALWLTVATLGRMIAYS